MNTQDYSRLRDVVGWQLEEKAQASFLDKRGSALPNEWKADLSSDDVEMVKAVDAMPYGYFTTWLNLAHLEKTASIMHSEFKNLWKWVKKECPWHVRTKNVSSAAKFSARDMYNFLYIDLKNLLFLLMYEQTDELNRWKECLKNKTVYTFPMHSFNGKLPN